MFHLTQNTESHAHLMKYQNMELIHNITENTVQCCGDDNLSVFLCLSPPQVHLKAPMILNGVCVIWRGWIDLQRLDGMGFLEYDDERAQVQTHEQYMCALIQYLMFLPLSCLKGILHLWFYTSKSA